MEEMLDEPYDPISKLSKQDVDNLEHLTTACSSLSFVCCLISIIFAATKARSTREFLGNIALWFQMACLLQSGAILFGAIYGYNGIRKEATPCRIQGFVILYALNSMLTWTALMNFNLFFTVYLERPKLSNIRVFHTIAWGYPFIPSVVLYVYDKYAPEATWCWVAERNSSEIVWPLMSLIVQIGLYLIIGALLWVLVIRKIYKIFKAKIREKSSGRRGSQGQSSPSGGSPSMAETGGMITGPSPLSKNSSVIIGGGASVLGGAEIRTIGEGSSFGGSASGNMLGASPISQTTLVDDDSPTHGGGSIAAAVGAGDGDGGGGGAASHDNDDLDSGPLLTKANVNHNSLPRNQPPQNLPPPQAQQQQHQPQGRSIALYLFMRYWRQLTWINGNLYIFILVVVGFILTIDDPGDVYFHYLSVASMCLIGTFCFLVLFATKDYWENFKKFVKNERNRYV